MKKILALILIISLLSGVLSVSTFASDNNSSDTADNFEHICFLEDDNRIYSNGYFEFTIRWGVTSDTFTANSSSITIQTCAWIYDSYDHSTYNDSSKRFQLTLYKANGTYIGSYIGYANSVYGGLSFSVTNGASYYFKISTLDALPDNCYVDGYGYVSPVTVN